MKEDIQIRNRRLISEYEAQIFRLYGKPLKYIVYYNDRSHLFEVNEAQDFGRCIIKFTAKEIALAITQLAGRDPATERKGHYLFTVNEIVKAP